MPYLQSFMTTFRVSPTMGKWDTSGDDDGDEEDSGFSPAGQIKQAIEEAEKEKELKLCMTLLGQDDTAKTGIVMDYMSNNDGRGLFLDLDGNAEPLKSAFYPGDSSIVVMNPQVFKGGDASHEVDYESTLENLTSLIEWVKDNEEEFDYICLDGISRLKKIAEYQMRIDKNITVEGKVNTQYWIKRGKVFRSVINLTKGIKHADRFFIGHDDMIIPREAAQKSSKEIKDEAEDKYPTDSGQQLKEIMDIPALVRKFHQSMVQRVITKKRHKGDTVEYVALIDKSKYNAECLDDEVVIAEKLKGDDGNEIKWHGTEDLFTKFKNQEKQTTGGDL